VGERAADGKREVRAKRAHECDLPLHSLAGGSDELRHRSNRLLPRSDSCHGQKKGTPLGVCGRNQRSEQKRQEKDGGRKQDAAKKGSGRAHKQTCERQQEARGHTKQEDAGWRARRRQT
jgi:hypothetical protein